MFIDDLNLKVSKWWSNCGYEILIVASVVFILIGGIIQNILHKKGKLPQKTRPIFVAPNKQTRNQSGQGTRAPPPRESSGEIECKRVIEKIFKAPFHKSRPDFLNNPVTGGNNNLELDCFNEKLRIAVEYNGAQHYKFIPFFHKNKEAFHNQKYRDYMKRKMCEENGIVLIEVPHTTKIPHIENYIKSNLRQYGIYV